MPNRFLAALMLALIPLTLPAIARADPAPTSQDAPAAGLGPSSSGDSSSLQPAGQSPLQSTTGDSTGLTAPNANPLQTTAPSDQTLQVLQGETDGRPAGGTNRSSKAPAPWPWIVLIALLAGLAIWFARRAGRVRRRRSLAITPSRADTSSEAIAETKPDAVEPAIEPGPESTPAIDPAPQAPATTPHRKHKRKRGRH